MECIMARHSLLILLFSLILCIYSPCAFAEDLPQSTVKELVKIVEEKAFAVPSGHSIDRFLDQSKINSRDVRRFLLSFDKWAVWTDKEEKSLQRKFLAEYKGGLGLSLVQSKHDALVCIPHPHEAADKGGVREGDILVGVDDFKVQSVPIKAVAVLLLGHPNTEVVLSVMRGNELLEIPIIRQKIEPAPHVEFFQYEEFAYIRIWEFQKNTPDVLVRQLQKINTASLVIDVRGNSGGNLIASLLCAAEFLPENTFLGMSQGDEREEPKTKRTRRMGNYFDKWSIIIWQDDLTASSAEAFVAALIDNEVAINMGETSFGKSFAQSVFEVEGNTLTLTTEELFGPDGESWADRGIEPYVPLKRASVKNLIRESYRYFNN